MRPGQLRDRAEELRVNAEKLTVCECQRIAFELATLAEQLADQKEALAIVMRERYGPATGNSASLQVPVSHGRALP